MLFSELDKITGGDLVRLHKDLQISHLMVDSRKLISYPGATFFAIEGEQSDGHRFLEECYEKGIRQFVIEKDTQLPEDTNVMRVENSLKALQQIASVHRSTFFYPIIGITGSNAKTIVKEWLATFLESRYHVVKSPKSFNSQLGVPLSVWQMNDNQNLGIFEAGISQVGEMTNLEKIIKPDIGIFTNIGSAHDAGFSSRAEKIQEKIKLFKSAKAIIYCRDHEEIHEQLSSHKRTQLISWTLGNSPATIKATIHAYSLKVIYQHKEFFFNTRFDNRIAIENLMHCIAASLVLGFSQHDIQSGIEHIKDVQMRLELKHGINGCYLVDDSYNNDLLGLEIALDFVNQQNQRAKKTVVLSDILQTGKDSAQLYFEVNELLKSKSFDRLVGIGPEISAHAKLFDLGGTFFDSTADFLEKTPSFEKEMVLVKGSRDFAFEKVVQRLEQKVHRTILEVNLDALAHNLNFYRSHLNPGTKLMVMVKAFAYGGSYEIANLLQYHNVNYLGVAYADEGVQLRKNGISIPIMVMNPTEDDFQAMEKYDLHPEIYSMEMLEKFITFFGDKPRLVPIHLKIETGMNRLGFKEEHIDELIEFIWKYPKLRIRGIFTHLASAEDNTEDKFTHQQVENFQKLLEKIRPHLNESPIIHAVNSAGILRFPEYHFDMVRLGIGLYGFESSLKYQEKLRVVSQLKTSISQLKIVKQGESVGYSRRGVAVTGDKKVAVLAIGYADGFRRAYSNGKGQVSINGHLVPVIGNVCMDMTMVDVTGLDVKVGEEVVVFGEKPTISDLAHWADTIPYEILTGVSQRVKRVFFSG